MCQANWTQRVESSVWVERMQNNVVRNWGPYFQALRAYNRQSAEVRARVARDYFDIASLGLDGSSRQRLIAYGHRERSRTAPPRPLSRPAR